MCELQNQTVPPPPHTQQLTGDKSSVGLPLHWSNRVQPFDTDDNKLTSIDSAASESEPTDRIPQGSLEADRARSSHPQRRCILPAPEPLPAVEARGHRSKPGKQPNPLNWPSTGKQCTRRTVLRIPSRQHTYVIWRHHYPEQGYCCSLLETSNAPVVQYYTIKDTFPPAYLSDVIIIQQQQEHCCSLLGTWNAPAVHY